MIKNIIFDIGNVLIGYRWQDMLMIDRGLPRDKAMKIGTNVFQIESWRQLDAGMVSVEEVISQLSEMLPDCQEDIKWFFENAVQMRVKRPAIWNEMKILREKGYRLYLLSNYCKELLEVHIGDTEIQSLVDGGVISYQIQHVKPEPEIYQYLLDKYRLHADQCLFFDDRPENVEAAVSQGISAIVVTDEKQLLQELQKL